MLFHPQSLATYTINMGACMCKVCLILHMVRDSNHTVIYRDNVNLAYQDCCQDTSSGLTLLDHSSRLLRVLRRMFLLWR